MRVESGARGRAMVAGGLAALWLLQAFPGVARGLEIPPEGQCPPYPITPGKNGPATDDVIAPALSPGSHIRLEGLNRLRAYLPPEIWQQREIFFYEGMNIEIGPCHRRYPVPSAIRQMTRGHRSPVRLDKDGNLLGYSGQGLPFPPDSISDDAADAGMRWAWNFRYRYQGAGFRGPFRIVQVQPRGRKVERFEGDYFWLPLAGYAGADPDDHGVRFWAGGRFNKPAISRGLAWRQLRKEKTDTHAARSDDVWVWLPDSRRVRRAPQFGVDGLFMPTYTRGQQAGGGTFNLPDGTGGTPGIDVGSTEHYRRGFVGLVIRPNAYRFRLIEIRDVLAPINSDSFGYPTNPGIPHGPSGLSVANGRWEIRRSLVLLGEHSDHADQIGSLKLYIDALTQAPLYLVSRRPNHLIREIGIFVGRFSGEDPPASDWAGEEAGTGSILPVAESFFLAGQGGWLRESFELRSDPPSTKERSQMTRPARLQHGH